MRSIVFLTFVLLTFATEVIRVDPYISHEDRRKLEKKAEQKFAVELLKARKHQDHLKQHIKKQLAVLKARKETYQKVRDSTTNEKKSVSNEIAQLNAQIKALDLEPAKARLEAKKSNSTESVADKKVADAIKKAVADKLKLSHKVTHKTLKVEKIAKRLQHYTKKLSEAERDYKRMEYKQQKLHAKITTTKKDIEAKKNQYIKRALRQLERIARVSAIKHMVKKIERELDQVENEEERKKLINKQKTAVTMLKRIEARVNIHKLRKSQRKARWNHIANVIKGMNNYKKGWKYDQKLRKLEVAKAVTAVNAIQKRINTLIHSAKKTGKVDAMELNKLTDKKNAAMNILEKARSALELFEEKGEKTIRNYKLRILRLKMADAKIRISEHQLSKDAAKVTKKEFLTRIDKLKKLQKRMGLCPLNRLRIKRRLRVYKKEVSIATRKIRRNNKRIHSLKIRVESIERRIRLIQKKRIAKIVRKLNHLKGKLNGVRHQIMAVRVRKNSTQKDILMVKVRTLQNIEKQLKNTIRRFVKRNGHVIRKLEQLRKAELEAARKYYKNKKAIAKRMKVVINRLRVKVAIFKRKIDKCKNSPFKQVRVIRLMKKYVKKLERTIASRKDMKLKVSTAHSRYITLRTKAINRLHTRRSELYARQAWLLSELKALAKRETDIHNTIKKTTVLKAMKGLYKELSFIRKEGKRVQLKLFKVVKRIQKVNQLFFRHNQYTAIRRAKVVFKKYNKKFGTFEKRKASLKRKMAVYQAEQNEIFKKQPYAVNKNALNDRLRLVKQAMSDIDADFATVQKQEKRVIVRALKLSHEYDGLLKVKLSDLKVRLAAKQKERPVVSKTALYTIDSNKQKHAVRRLKVIDSSIEELDNSIEKTVRKIKKTHFRIGKLKAALRPEGKKCNKQTDCKICRKLGKVAKYGIVHHESDSIIINRLRSVCTRINADRQKECYHQAMNMAMKALHTFDPSKFVVSEVCSSLGKC
ncbi:hypothetical protein ENUP19_0305G0079 [Entamoeba nuttalli]|uniref:Saposin B-type domain-containing protein n=2 Tax=Entamoeba nuttalli TaxID=412467 RepID=K2HCZ6_ENTNP|nr:hypothetical protein ENU1_085880 [Entamoeba nuttalli P19]EKE40609.1 hypothetical protein ENU1_085880 [Entamoeba nuttalli P19]|eukprot:XP_008857085.1 hypothetical protein ENU1_085880 [Entamoeba nuttalli P19]